MSDLRDKLVIWVTLGAGQAASAFLLTGNWLLLTLWGVLIGLVLPVISHKVAPVRATGSNRPTRSSADSMGNEFRWVGAIVAALGGFLLWKMLGEGGAQQVFDDGHPWLASMSVYLAGLPVGLGLNMMATKFSFMRQDSGGSS